MIERTSRIKPRTIASSPEMSITTIKTISSSVIGMVCWSPARLACPSDEAPGRVERPGPGRLYSRSRRFRHPRRVEAATKRLCLLRILLSIVAARPSRWQLVMGDIRHQFRECRDGRKRETLRGLGAGGFRQDRAPKAELLRLL